LVVLGKSFGIAPADRGLVTKAPYNLVRHPMYLGELVHRCALVGATLSVFNLVLLAVLIAIQLMRIDMEENIITGYTKYQTQTRWRLVPGIW
jgi:protein-S-isoprenylcysteine O-methyltransferase Ste14